MKKIGLLLFLCGAILFTNCHRHNPYKGLCKEDREKMKLVARHNKAVAEGGGCPATKQMKKEADAKKKADEKLSKQSQKQAGVKR